jgi:multidrug efflux system membrane fusion protein
MLMAALIVLASCEKKETHEKPPAPVVVGVASQKDVPIYLETMGNAYALATVDIRPQVSGELLKAHIGQGALVKEGELLYTIDPAPYQAQLDKAKADYLRNQAELALARDTLQRNAPLLRDEFISQLTYEQYGTNVKSLEAQMDASLAEIEKAEINLGYCYISSPINGKLSQYIIDPGNIVNPQEQQAISTIRQLSPIEVRFTVPQRDFQKITKAQTKGELTVEATLPDEKNPIIGDLHFIDNQIDLNTGTIMLKALMANTDYQLWPGAFVYVKILLYIQKDALVVPEASVQVGPKGYYLFVIKDDDTADKREVKVIEKLDGEYVLEGGVQPGEKVVVDGQVLLNPGSKVVITEPKKTT